MSACQLLPRWLTNTHLNHILKFHIMFVSQHLIIISSIIMWRSTVRMDDIFRSGFWSTSFRAGTRLTVYRPLWCGNDAGLAGIPNFIDKFMVTINRNWKYKNLMKTPLNNFFFPWNWMSSKSILYYKSISYKLNIGYFNSNSYSKYLTLFSEKSENIENSMVHISFLQTWQFEWF